jgi:hypothetical protein
MDERWLMEKTQEASFYRVWGADKVAYGPLELATLIQWIQEGRLTDKSWVLSEAAGQWLKAAEVAELRPHFAAEAAPPAPVPGVAPEILRRIKLFAGFEESQLNSFLHYLDVVRFPQFSHIVRQGDWGEAMYIVAEGEVRVLTIVEGRETTLATLSPGDFFGEISVLDQGPRSADVIANRDSVLLRLSQTAFERLVREAPTLAVPFLLALSRAVVQSVRHTNKKYEDSIRFIRTKARGQ